MQTGKILGIGAALSAGLLAAHVASASVQLFLSGSSGYEYLPTAPSSSSSYTTSSANNAFGGFSWSSITAAETSSSSGAVVTLTVNGLVNTTAGSTSPFDSLSIYAIGGGFAALPKSDNVKLQTINSSGTYSDSSSNDQVSMQGIAASTNSSGSTFSNSQSYLALAGNASTGVSYTVPETVVGPTLDALGAPATYSLETLAAFTLSSTSSVYNGTFVTTLTGAAPAAVSLPGSGPLTIIGGLVMVGGLAIRRRIKV